LAERLSGECSQSTQAASFVPLRERNAQLCEYWRAGRSAGETSFWARNFAVMVGTIGQLTKIYDYGATHGNA
jgi:hypothetical protein